MISTGIKSIDEIIEKKIKAAEKRKYFVGRELYECNKLIPELEEIIKDYKNSLRSWYTTSWKNAEDAAMKACSVDISFKYAFYPVGSIDDDVILEVVPKCASRVECAATYAGIYIAFMVGLNAYWGVPDDVPDDDFVKVIGEAAKYAIIDVLWEITRYIKGYGDNPFEKIVKIYDMGLYPRGFRKRGRTEKFVVDFPLKTYKLGCWAEGENELLYMHGWDEYCSKRKRVKSLRIHF
jgi:hypothetical protein